MYMICIKSKYILQKKNTCI